MCEYLQQAKAFCEKTNTTIDVAYLKTDKHFDGDTDKRDIYNVTITRKFNMQKSESFSFSFGSSIADTEKNQEKRMDYTTGRMKPTGRRKQVVKPSEYDVLACLQKYEIGDFDDFCFDYGYTFDTERKYVKVKQIYFAVVDEYRNVCRLFHDVMEELEEIC